MPGLLASLTAPTDEWTLRRGGPDWSLVAGAKRARPGAGEQRPQVPHSRYTPASSKWPPGRMLSFLGSWAFFWLSFTDLLLGLTHDWFALPAEDVTPVVALFLISWLVVIAGLTVFTLRLPRHPPRSSRWWPSRWPWCWPRH